MSKFSSALKTAMDTAPQGAVAYVDEVRSKLELAVFSQIPTMRDDEKDSIADLICIFVFAGYQRGQKDTLTEVKERWASYLSDFQKQEE